MSAFTDLINIFNDNPGGGVFKPVFDEVFGNIRDWFNGIFNQNNDTGSNRTPSEWIRDLLGTHNLNDLMNLFSGSSSSMTDKMLSSEDLQALFNKMDEQAKAVNEFNQSSADKAMQFEADQAQLNRDFQMDLIKNGYQYAVESMQNAGLNPALAYSNGPVQVTSGAMASGSSANGEAPDYSGIMKVLILALSGITTSALKLVK